LEQKSMSNLRLGVAALALASMTGLASAQTTTPSTAPADNKPAAATSTNTTTPPLPGANSFTEAQARERITEAGFKDVKELKKDDQGIWRGMAKKGDTQVNVGLDYKGNVVQQ
jgi:hypothetical protein